MSGNDFECLNCRKSSLEKDEVVEILNCKHSYCWNCLTSYIESNLNSQIKCPFNSCVANLNDDLIRQVLPVTKISDYEEIILSSIFEVEEQCFKCLTPKCEYIGFFTDKNIQFECPRCSLFNCISCVATHPFLSCDKYRLLKESALKNEEDKSELQIMEENEFLKAEMILMNNKQIRSILDKQKLDSCDFIPTDKSFTCTTCLKIVPKETGIKLRNCSHIFCKSCLHGAIVNSEVIPVACLDNSCKSTIQEREIRAILNEQEYESFNDKSLMVARSKLRDIFHCKKPNCKYFGMRYDLKMKYFICPACESLNCFKCNAVHNDLTCKEFQKSNSISKTLDEKSIAFIEREIKAGKSMKCPTCGCIVEKAGGCNWIKCPQCKLELCWVLKMPRWGPKGNGDMSGGCKCGVNNKLCSPKCLFGCIPEN